MKILVLCDEGNNRSVTIASNIKYLGHDVLPAGINTNSAETLAMLQGWADMVIITEPKHSEAIKGDKVRLWNVGADTYPRPYNRQLLLKVRDLMEHHKEELKA